jgi:DNA repair exonuclease SbcCD ATPase subunit
VLDQISAGLLRAKERLRTKRKLEAMLRETQQLLGDAQQRCDAAREHAYTAQRCLRSFQKELADADERLSVSLEIGGFAKFADYFFDGLIADWVVQSKIHNASSACSSALSQVSAVLGKCRKRLTEVETAIEEVKNEQREFVERV